MSERSALDKRKVWLFLVLVAVALLCVVVLIYALMFARPRTTPTIQQHGHTLLRQTKPLPGAGEMSVPEQQSPHSGHSVRSVTGLHADSR